MEESIELKSVNVAIRNIAVLEDITFRMNLPKFVTIIGPNGAGKTTLLKTLIGLIKPTSGIIRVLGFNPVKDALKLRRYMGYVPQRERIELGIPVKVKSVVLMGILCRKKPPRIVTSRDVRQAREALSKVGLNELWDKKFSELSGGQQQRILIARALATRPRLLLLDEPLSAVDVKSQWEILETLKRLEREEKIGVILVTHDINPIIEYTDEVILLNRRIIAKGNITEVITEENLRKAYGPNIRVVKSGTICYAITGDVHA